MGTIEKLLNMNVVYKEKKNAILIMKHTQYFS